MIFKELKKRNPKNLDKLLEENLDPNDIDKDTGNTVLQFLITKELDDEVKSFILKYKNTINWEILNKSNENYLDLSIISKNLEIISEILLLYKIRNININQETILNSISLYWNDEEEIWELLIKNGLEINKVYNNKNNLLISLFKYNNIDLLIILISNYDIDYKFVDTDGNNFLINSILSKQINVAKLIFDKIINKYSNEEIFTIIVQTNLNQDSILHILAKNKFENLIIYIEKKLKELNINNYNLPNQDNLTYTDILDSHKKKIEIEEQQKKEEIIEKKEETNKLKKRKKEETKEWEKEKEIIGRLEAKEKLKEDEVIERFESKRRLFFLAVFFYLVFYFVYMLLKNKVENKQEYLIE